METPLV